jgi:protein disulfide-isomerase
MDSDRPDEGNSMRKLLAIALMALAGLSIAADQMYDESADAKAEITKALAQAGQAKVPVLVVFGANWCGDCKILDMAFKSGTSAPLINKSFKVVKVNVGRFDQNLDVAERYGVPLKLGIPAVAVLASDGSVTYATRGGELADARKMGETGIYDFSL